jgi:hypothetical protein
LDGRGSLGLGVRWGRLVILLRATLDSLLFAMMFDIEAIIRARRLFA